MEVCCGGDTGFGRRRGSALLLIWSLLVLLSTTNSAPVFISNANAMMYLSQFGWVDPSMKKSGSEALVDIRRAIEDFQSFAGLNQTGELDDETVELMNTPRCGVKDKIGHDARRRRRYAIQGSRWGPKARDLTYRVTKYPRNLDQNAVDAEVTQAFKVWEKHANLTFAYRPSGKVHIEIRFEKREHGDGDAFDGEGGTLAHAYFPQFGGDAHFDDDEKWSIKSTRGTNLFQVAAHEFGHSLGLSHSDVRGALMAPFYRGYQEQFQLDNDDILGIQQLYGKKFSGPITSTTKKPIKGGSFDKHPQENKLCTDSNIDAITSMSDGHTYVFKGSDFYRLTDNGVADGYPQLISSTFDKLPSHIDAAFTWTNERTYFFKGSKFWRFSKMKMDIGYPKEISDGFTGIPSNIDTATVWSGNGKIYFFKGDHYWRYDPVRNPQVSLGYPKPISNWNGIPNKLDAALRYTNGYTYFFKANKYWRFNDRSFAVDNADPAFPRVVENWWYGCGKKQTMKTSGRSPSPDYQNDSTGETGEDGDSGSSSDVILTSNRLLTNLWIAFILPFVVARLFL